MALAARLDRLKTIDVANANAIAFVCAHASANDLATVVADAVAHALEAMPAPFLTAEEVRQLASCPVCGAGIGWQCRDTRSRSYGEYRQGANHLPRVDLARNRANELRLDTMSKEDDSPAAP